jgi:outer membrane protein assembly factor BamB
LNAVSRRDALKIAGAAFSCGALRYSTPHAGAAEIDEQAVVKPDPGDWPWWRGPIWNAHAVGEVPPLVWNETENVRWKIAIPGRGHATPCLWGDHVFLATADEAKQTQSLVCLARADGRIRWQKQIHSGGFMEKHEKNSHASATPACDGERVFTVFLCHDNVWATALDFAGEVVWQKKLGIYDDRYGYGSSPTIFANALIVTADSPGDGYLVALDRATGDEIWRTPRPKLTSYGPPLVARLDGIPQIVVQGNTVAGYDPLTGRELWTTSAPAKATACSLCFDDARVYASGGYPERRIYGVLATAEANAEARVAWRFEQKSAVAYVPSPILVGERLFVVSDGGLASCLNVADGKPLWTERLGGDFSASPTLIGDLLFAANEEGRTTIFKAADRFERVGENKLAEGIYASPVICGGKLFLRTTGHLYCIGAA